MFLVENLLREARRQRHLGDTPVPEVCLLDPDGDVVRHLNRQGRARRHHDWACYHSELWVTDVGELELGIVPCAVGAPYAVLVAEELAASGCSLLISITSAGSITPLDHPPYFVLIERAWRGEGTREAAQEHHFQAIRSASVTGVDDVVAVLPEIRWSR